LADLGSLHRRGVKNARINYAVIVSGDESRAALVPQIEPGLFGHDDEAIAKTDQIKDVHA
jgi:hypothetical protein